jgi:ribosomal protein S14
VVACHRFAARRRVLKDIFLEKKSHNDDETFLFFFLWASRKLAVLPRNAYPTRIRNRCSITVRVCAYCRKFGVSRIQLGEFVSSGRIPGVIKASWPKKKKKDTIGDFGVSRKATAYAAQTVRQDADRVVISHGFKEVEVRVKGPGMGCDAAIRAPQSRGLTVNAILDTTQVPHNVCRPRKRRRI